MQERYVALDGETVFLRHSDLRPGRRTLLFIHGLGESGLCFQEAFERLAGLDYNLVAPDNIGYGRSSAARDGDYLFGTQIGRLARLVAELGVGRLTLVGHSLGGMLATYWPEFAPATAAAEAIVDIEGNLTPDDATFSKDAVTAYEDCGRDFGRWCLWLRDEFMEKTILAKHCAPCSWHTPAWESCRRYYASLWFCRPEAFLAHSQEIMRRNKAVKGATASAMGQTYAQIPLRKVYCWGTKSLSGQSQRFLQDSELAHRPFHGAMHWPMIDRGDEFYRFLAEWVGPQAAG